jgi:hypothetical protein
MAAINGTTMAASTADTTPTSDQAVALQPVISRLDTLTVRFDELVDAAKKLIAAVESSTAPDRRLSAGIKNFTEAIDKLDEKVNNVLRTSCHGQDVMLTRSRHTMSDECDLPVDHPLTHRKPPCGR